MKAKSGKAPSAVKPAAPKEVFDADEADPGEMAAVKAEQAATKQGKYGQARVTPYKPPPAGGGAGPASSTAAAAAQEEKTSWIEIELVDEAGEPVPGERYEITLPDGRVASGTLDDRGFARVDGIEPGTCQVTFPELDASAWEKA